MRALVVAGVAAGLVLAGCGSAQTSAPVESGSASGAVASAEECPANAPVRGILRGEDWATDGVYGHVYNETAETLFVWSQDKRAASPCVLGPGKGASFGAASYSSQGADAAWVPWNSTTFFFVLVTKANDVSAPGVSLELWDPYVGTPKVNSRYRTASGSKCRDDAVLETGSLKEDAEYRLKGSEQGSVLVKRLGDSTEIAREWMDTRLADDWARLDLYVESIGSCS